MIFYKNITEKQNIVGVTQKHVYKSRAESKVQQMIV